MEIVEAIAEGQIWANAAELRYVLDEFRKAPKPIKMDPGIERRMKREADVARWAVEGLSNREIARKLGLVEHTAKNYLSRIFDKLGVSNRVELNAFLFAPGRSSPRRGRRSCSVGHCPTWFANKYGDAPREVDAYSCRTTLSRELSI
jgi:DNA-binding CsgD family transcriptional regulator